MTTPTPGDLSARHVEVLREMFAAAANERRMKEADALAYAIAALSALPAAGGGDVLDAVMNEALRNGTGIMRIDPASIYTTPQPSAAEGAHGAQTEDELLAAFVQAHDDEEAWLERTGHLYDPHLPTRAGIRAVQAALAAPAAVGAQGDGWLVVEAWVHGGKTAELKLQRAFRGDDESVVLDLSGQRISFASAAPAAGKGVDDAAALAEFTRYFVKNYPGPDTIIHDPNWHAPRIFRAAQAALTRQPVAGDGWIERAARCAEEILRGPLIDVPPEERTNGFTTGVRHLAWMATKLAAKDVGSETKTCRWLGYLQGGLVTLGYSTLDTEKQRNLRSAAPAATPTDGGSDHG